MNEENQDRLTLIGATLGGLVVGAVFGAFALPFVVRFASDLLDFDGNVPHLRVYCAGAGAVLGGLQALRKVSKQIRRRQATRGVAENLGMQYSAQLDDQLHDDLVLLFGDRGWISVSNAAYREIEGARFVVADLGHRQSSGGDSNSKTTHQTIAYFSSEKFQFPKFELQPEGMMLNLLTGIIGVHDIDFDDYPEFSKRYHLTGTDTDRIRRLFGDALLRHFTEHPGWQVKAGGDQILLFRPRKRCNPAELERFMNEAMATFSLFMTAASSLAQKDSSIPPQVSGGAAPLAPAGAAPPAPPGLLGVLAEASRVSRAEQDRFLAAPPPREIPRKVLRQRLGGGSLIGALIGCVFLVAGLILAAVALFGMEGPMDEERWVASILGTVFPLVGATLAFFTIRYRRRNYRLLRYGVLAEGTIAAVERTDVTVNNQRQYRMKVRFADGLGRTSSSCNIYGRLAEEARRRHQENLPVRVLYDRQAPKHILWADAFALPKF